MKLNEHIDVDYVGGEVVLKARVAALLLPKLESLKAKFESGEIDLIKGTDLDKRAALLVLDALIKEVTK